MPKHGDIRRLSKVYIHDDKVIKRKEVFQRYVEYPWYDGGGSYWTDIDTETKAIEVHNLEYFEKCEKEGFYYE